MQLGGIAHLVFKKMTVTFVKLRLSFVKAIVGVVLLYQQHQVEMVVFHVLRHSHYFVD